MKTFTFILVCMAMSLVGLFFDEIGIFSTVITYTCGTAIGVILRDNYNNRNVY